MNINFRLIISLLGYIISTTGILMLIPAIIDYFTHYSKGVSFFIFSLVTSFIGFSMIFSNDKNKNKDVIISSKDGLLLTFLSWISVVIFAALPFSFSYLNMSYEDSLFESMSGITTTGASVIQNLDQLSYGFHFWRVLIGWLGGIGIIVTGTILIPYMQGGMSIFKVEAFETFDSAISHAKKLALGVTLIYIIITVAVAFALIFIANINIFDSLIHAMSSVSTLGFSNKDLSIYDYHSLSMEIIVSLSMITGGIPYILMYYFLFLRKINIFKDKQIIAFFKIMLIVSILLILWLHFNLGFKLNSAIRYGVFAIINTMTGSGFTTYDYPIWGTFPLMILFALTIIGGCAGSKSGGVKIFRIQIIYILVKISLEKIFLNKHKSIPFYNGKEISNEVALNVFAYWFIFTVSIFACATIITFFEIDFATAFAASLACISNMGLALGGEVGPIGSYAALPTFVKVVLSFGMLLGRLEFLVVLVLFNRKFWSL